MDTKNTMKDINPLRIAKETREPRAEFTLCNFCIDCQLCNKVGAKNENEWKCTWSKHVNGVTGEVTFRYCAWKNPFGNCEDFLK